jgi:PIN domain
MPASLRPPLVVIDTTVVRADMRLASAAWNQALALSRRGALQLHIPRVVLLEAVRHYERQTASAEKEVRTAWSTLARFGVDLDSEYQAEALKKLAEAAADYETMVATKLGAVNAGILPLPQVSHEELVARDLSSRKPFSTTGKGYRDALIWASIVELCRGLTEADTLIFVTDNKTDFCDADEPTIAQELLTDLPTGLRVLRYANLKAMLSQYEWQTEPPPTPDLHEEPSLAEQMKQAITSASDRLVGSEIEDPYHPEPRGWGPDFDFGDWPLPTGLETISVESVEPDLASLHWEVYDADETRQLAKVTVDADVVLDGYMSHADYYAHEESVGTHDADWNDHFAWVYIERPFRLTFDAYISPDLQTVEHVEFDAAASHLPPADDGPA